MSAFNMAPSLCEALEDGPVSGEYPWQAPT